ncbi:MAG: tRNA (adenosine(37)-N6)-dimethylallyltransferase MiaA [Candidatus Pacebacteria bacterium]|jgi:tRNA dimethylallyltransferase|nr:tRNA (adenosine(37)-N6)-dimethylallyltransferase MiaA [Candidatus Paceibacterota bacterium]
MTQKLIAIVGQTATGKSDFAVEVARAIDGEIISADSRQVYKGLAIGTGKITKKEMREVPHHLLDVVNPKRQFTVADFTRLSDKSIRDILKRKKVPILCGGTGFYIDAVVFGKEYPEVPPNKKLRDTLEKYSTAELFNILKKHDPKRALTIDQNNPVRLIRAIEIVKHLGKVPYIKTEQKWQSLVIGFSLPREILKQKIQIRLLKRLKAGMLAEAKRLHTNGLSYKRMEALGLEYRYQARYLQGSITKTEMIEQLTNEIFQYAKRQETWFKRNKNIIWIDPRKISERKKVLRMIKKFLQPTHTIL